MLGRWLPKSSDPTLRWFVAIWMAVMSGIAMDTALPLYVLQHGGTALDVGWFFAGPILLSLPIQLPVGRLIDRIGSAPVFIVARVIGGLACLALAWGQGPLWLLILFRATHGFNLAATVPALRNAISSLTPTEELGKRFSQLQSVVYTGDLLGPILAGVIATAFAPAAVFFVGYGVSILTGIIIGTTPFHAGSRASGPQQAPVQQPNRTRLFSQPLIVCALLLSSLNVYVGMFTVLWPQYITARGYSPLFVGLAVSTAFLPMVAFAPQVAKLSASRWRNSIIAGCLLAALSCSLVYPSIRFFPIIIGIELIQWSALAFVNPSVLSILTEATPASIRGRTMAVAGFGENLGAIVGTVGLGSLYAFNRSAPFVAAAAWLGGLVAIAMTLLPRRPADATPEPAGSQADRMNVEASL